MSYRDMARRLEELEARRQHREQTERQAWLESLSDAELEALIAEEAEHDSVGHAALEALSDADLERLHAGMMPDAEWGQHLQRAQERIETSTR